MDTKKRADQLQPGDMVNLYPYAGFEDWMTVSKIVPFGKALVLITVTKPRWIGGQVTRYVDDMIIVRGSCDA